ncbi:MAG TPA: hypothetical protein VHE78_19215 [Gemmatimonadaceae bacterium]|nr:hypothetical protein [Gemmatimonadaceae bacterium]
MLRHPAAFVLVLLLAASPRIGAAQRPVDLAPNAPKDKPVWSVSRCQLDALRRALEPFAVQARATYPAVRDRFLAGLPPQHMLSVTTRLRDANGHEEQIFVIVDSIRGSTIAGRIGSPIQAVEGFHFGQPYSLGETELIDWTISRPDGSEEGNLMGKFIDTYRPPAACTDLALAGRYWFDRERGDIACPT